MSRPCKVQDANVGAINHIINIYINNNNIDIWIYK